MKTLANIKSSKMIIFSGVKTSLTKQKKLSLSQMVDYESTLFIHKIVIGLVKSDYQLFTNFDVTNRSTRQSNQLRPAHFHTTKAQKSIYYRGINLYNAFKKSQAQTNVRINSLASTKENLKAFISRE